MTPMPDTVGRLYDNVRGLYRLGINQFIIGPASGVSWPEDALAEYGRQVRLLAAFHAEQTARKAPFRMTLFEKDLDAAPGRNKGKWGCGAGRGRVCVGIDGSLYGCAKILGVDGLRGTHKLGTVWEGYTNPRARLELLDDTPLRRTQCRDCDYADDCCGGCPATNYETTGSIFLPSPLDCTLTRIVADLRRERDDGAAPSAQCTMHTPSPPPTPPAGT